MAEQDKTKQDQVKQYTLGGGGTGSPAGKRQSKRRPGRGKRRTRQDENNDQARSGKRTRSGKFSFAKKGSGDPQAAQDAAAIKQDQIKVKVEPDQTEDKRPGNKGPRRQGKSKNFKQKVAQVTKSPQTIADLKQDNVRLEKEILLDIKSIQQIDLE